MVAYLMIDSGYWLQFLRNIFASNAIKSQIIVSSRYICIDGLIKVEVISLFRRWRVSNAARFAKFGFEHGFFPLWVFKISKELF